MYNVWDWFDFEKAHFNSDFKSQGWGRYHSRQLNDLAKKKEICVVSPAESCNDSFGAARTRTFPFSSDSAYNHMYIIHDLV